ncbi:YpbS family protein [Bacillus altitudinis]|uniref:YpbS family protein n=1 Tax=Bacillus altitudinis TaxID=293387 RepID=UPI0021061CC7|nr:YpbS family protein [Bacillus altitudinis]UTX07299.1 YpbS family protein [Bacillus altitudinis]
MTSVHEEISAHSQKQHAHIQSFLALEQKREQAIESAVKKCEHNEPFSTDEINAITSKMNELARGGIVPLRKHVTIEMVGGIHPA